MYPYLLTTDARRTTIYGYRKIHLIQKELNQIVNHKVVQLIMQQSGWNCAENEKAIKIVNLLGNTE